MSTCLSNQMFEQYTSPIFIERVAFILHNGLKSQTERQDLAIQGIEYLRNLNYTKSPHWDLLVSESGLRKDQLIINEYIDDHSLGQCVLIKKIISHEYIDALHILESKEIKQNEYFQKLESVVNLNILAKQYHSIVELDHHFKNNNDLHGLVREEKAALRRTQLLICVSYYLQKRFFECCSSFFKFLTNDSEILKYIDTQESKYPVIRREEFLLMITISLIVSIPLDNYASFIYLPDVKPFFKLYPIALKCLELLIHTGFNRFFLIWENSIGATCKYSMFLCDSWEFAQFTMRSKIYFFYIRVSTKLQISYISKISNIDEQQAKFEIETLIKSARLNVEILDDIISYKHKRLIEDVVETLTRNEIDIQGILNRQASKNHKLRDVAQKNIVDNKERIEISMREQKKAEIINDQDFNDEDYEEDDLIVSIDSEGL